MLYNLQVLTKQMYFVLMEADKYEKVDSINLAQNGGRCC